MSYGSYTEIVPYSEHPTISRLVTSHPERWYMRASSVTARLPARLAGRLAAGLSVRDWAWWRLPVALRAYVGAVPAVALVLAAAAAAATAWTAADLMRFGLLLSCGSVSVVATQRFA